MKSLVFIFLFLSTTFQASASSPVQNINELLERVRTDRQGERSFLRAREQEFVQKLNEREAMLRRAKQELARVEARARELQGVYEKNETEIGELQSELRVAVGTLGELFGVVNQISGDLSAQVRNSIVSAQIPGREDFLARMSRMDELPTISELEQLWFELQREMTETQRVVTFDSEVVLTNGEKRSQPVTRVGAFNLLSNGRYLVYESETNQILQLDRQPPGHLLSTARRLERGGENDLIKFGLDPSRGTLLAILVDSPGLRERINQGGVVGYILIVLLLIGLGISIERMVVLTKEEKRLRAQLDSETIDTNNPIGQLKDIFKKYSSQSTETLESKMNEAIIKYLPRVERGIGTIKIFAAVGPLLGLLGTVTGMIGTFQAITLFGTGDPQLMAGGISMALITTVMGLIVAIPLLLLHTVVSTRSKRIVQLLEEESAGLIAGRSH